MTRSATSPGSVNPSLHSLLPFTAGVRAVGGGVWLERGQRGRSPAGWLDGRFFALEKAPGTKAKRSGVLNALGDAACTPAQTLGVPPATPLRWESAKGTSQQPEQRLLPLSARPDPSCQPPRGTRHSPAPSPAYLPPGETVGAASSFSVFMVGPVVGAGRGARRRQRLLPVMLHRAQGREVKAWHGAMLTASSSSSVPRGCRTGRPARGPPRPSWQEVPV